MWRVKAELNSLVSLWAELAAYQKAMRCEPHPPQNLKENGEHHFLDKIDHFQFFLSL